MPIYLKNRNMGKFKLSKVFLTENKYIFFKLSKKLNFIGNF